MTTQVLVIFVIRTGLAAWRDRPSAWLVAASLCVVAAAVALPFLPWSRVVGLVPLPGEVLLMVVTLTLAYLAVAEAMKHGFHRWMRRVPAAVRPTAPTP
jgi:Mg2+-importing ATPase